MSRGVCRDVVSVGRSVKAGGQGGQGVGNRGICRHAVSVWAQCEGPQAGGTE